MQRPPMSRGSPPLSSGSRSFLRQPGLAQTFVDARALGVEGRVVAEMNAHICLHGEAGIDFLQLSHGLLGLLVVADPGVGGSEKDPRVEYLRRTRARLLAPFDRLFPLRQKIVEAQTSCCQRGTSGS